MEANQGKLDYVCFFSKQRTDHPIHLFLLCHCPFFNTCPGLPFSLCIQYYWWATQLSSGMLKSSNQRTDKYWWHKLFNIVLSGRKSPPLRKHSCEICRCCSSATYTNPLLTELEMYVSAWRHISHFRTSKFGRKQILRWVILMIAGRTPKIMTRVSAV